MGLEPTASCLEGKNSSQLSYYYRLEDGCHSAMASEPTFTELPHTRIRSAFPNMTPIFIGKTGKTSTTSLVPDGTLF